MKFVNKYNLLQIVIATLVIIFTPILVHAQDPGGGPDAPIDGGLSVLIAAGVGYGVKKYRSERKKRMEKEL